MAKLLNHTVYAVYADYGDGDSVIDRLFANYDDAKEYVDAVEQEYADDGDTDSAPDYTICPEDLYADRHGLSPSND